METVRVTHRYFARTSARTAVVIVPPPAPAGRGLVAHARVAERAVRVVVLAATVGSHLAAVLFPRGVPIVTEIEAPARLWILELAAVLMPVVQPWRTLLVVGVVHGAISKVTVRADGVGGTPLRCAEAQPDLNPNVSELQHLPVIMLEQIVSVSLRAC